MMKSNGREARFIRHSIRFKIFLVSLLPTPPLLGAALLKNQYLNALGKSAKKMLSKNYKSIRAAQETRKTLDDSHQNQHYYRDR